MKKITLILFLSIGTFFTNFASAQSPCNANGTMTPTGNPGEFTITDLSTAGNGPYSYFQTDNGPGGVNYLPLQPLTTSGTIQYTADGTYNYFFAIGDSLAGCWDSLAGTITIIGINTPPPCQAAFTIIQDSTNQGVYWCWNNSTGGTPALGLTYLWDFGDGSTSTQAYPTHTYNSLGAFLVCLTVSDPNSSCTSTTCDTIIVSVKASGTTLNVLPPGASASIDEIESITGLALYPNPTEEKFVIEMSSKNQGNIEVSIVNLAGQTNFSSNYSLLEGSNKIELNASNLNAGVYFVKIHDLNSNSTQTLHLIKK
jgi:PKD repeat protein